MLPAIDRRLLGSDAVEAPVVSGAVRGDTLVLQPGTTSGEARPLAHPNRDSLRRSCTDWRG